MAASGASLLDKAIKHGSFYCHATIACGGQGTVYLATGDDRALSRICVVKTFSARDADALDRARRSIRTQLSLMDQACRWPAPLLPHDDQIRPAPWVPDILAWNLNASAPWVAQDFRGTNLRRYLAAPIEAGRTRPDEVSLGIAHVRDRVLSQIVIAVEFVHLQGVVHRDLKPDNVLVEKVAAQNLLMESIALCDFDLSKDRGRTALTQTAAQMGSFGYSAPEQLWGGARHATFASDVYSVGMLAVFVYTGRQPWEVLIGPDPTRMTLDPAIAERLGSKRDWVEQALSVHPDARPALGELHRYIYGPDAGR